MNYLPTEIFLKWDKSKLILDHIKWVLIEL